MIQNQKNTTINDTFWSPRIDMNAKKAVFHQWEQLKKTGCINNFRLIADRVEGVRLGYFYADSDAYKWLDAAARVYATHPSQNLKRLMDEFIDLIRRTQEPDGYIYTYNQYFFPGNLESSMVRWHNLQIEHELYCHGHLIEAAVSHFKATGEEVLLNIAIKAADLIVEVFSNRGPEGSPGHQEIEIALIRLYRITGNKAYLDMAEHFIEVRGRIKPFITHILGQNNSFKKRSQFATNEVSKYTDTHPEFEDHFTLPPDNYALKPRWGKVRWFLNTASGKYLQQHKPVRELVKPEGHAVRFAYLETAIAMLYQNTKDEALLNAMKEAWEHMVTYRMYITGGVGALPNIEGFGRDYELDPFFSYSETCASLGLILWNWEMSQITSEAKYADLTEWQLYNGAAVGLGQDGTSYLYNNPLSSRSGLSRYPWFRCACCPSNISRIWADLGKYVSSYKNREVFIEQYIGGEWYSSEGIQIKMESHLPWKGNVTIEILIEESKEFVLNLRVPSWCTGFMVRINGEEWKASHSRNAKQHQTASGFNPSKSWYLPIQRIWTPEDQIELTFEMPVKVWNSHPKVKATRGKVAISRGPIVYCLENIDNPGVDIFNVELDSNSLQFLENSGPFKDVLMIHGKTKEGSPVKFLPYYLWANRGPSQMTVYISSPQL